MSEHAIPRLSRSFLVVACLLTAIGLLYQTIDARTVLSECLVVWPSFVWVLLLAPRVALLAMRNRRLEFIASIVLVAAFLACTVAWRSLLRSPSDATIVHDVLRVVTWNVAGGLPLRDLELNEPDLCLLQEVLFAVPSRLPGRWAGFTWLGTLDPGALSRHRVTPLTTG